VRKKKDRTLHEGEFSQGTANPHPRVKKVRKPEGNTYPSWGKKKNGEIKKGGKGRGEKEKMIG